MEIRHFASNLTGLGQIYKTFHITLFHLILVLDMVLRNSDLFNSTYNLPYNFELSA